MRTRHSLRSLAWVTAVALAISLFPVSGLLPADYSSTASAAAANKVKICHRTRSVSNPYRLITVASSSVKNSGGHTGHTGGLFNAAGSYTTAASKNWGDIIPPPATGNAWNDLNWSTAGQDVYFGRTTGSNGAMCKSMTALQFYNSEFAAIKGEGLDDATAKSQALASLDQMAATEDASLLSSLGSGQTFTTYFSSNDPNASSSWPNVPSLATTPATSVGTTSATLNASLSCISGYSWSALQFLIDDTPDLANPTAVSVSTPSCSGVTSAVVSTARSSLAQNKTYYFALSGTLTPTGGTGSTVDSNITQFTTGLGSQVISFTSSAPSPAGSGTTYSVSATGGGSGNTVVFTIAGATQAQCSIASGNQVTMLANSGTCTILADQAGNATYNPAATASQSVTLSDISAPTLSSSTPADNATGVGVTSNITLVFSEAVVAGSTGAISLHKSDSTVVEQFTTSSSARVSGWNSATIVIDPTNALDPSTDYYLTIDSTAIKDSSSNGNAFAGFSSASTLNFRTVAAPEVTTTTLPAGVVGVAYSQNLGAQYGSGTYSSWSVISGSLPSGLSLSDSGVISGNPSASGTSNFTVKVTDSAGVQSAGKSLSITVNTRPSVSTSTLDSGTLGASYHDSLAATGGSGTYSTWAVSSGSLPTGLSLTAGTGSIDGTPTVVGTSSFSVTVTDNAGVTSEAKALSITVSATALTSRTITAVASPASPVTFGSTTTITGTPSAGAGTVTYSVTSGSDVCSIDTSTGVLTPLMAGACAVQASVGASGGFDSAQSASLSITVVRASRTMVVGPSSTSTTYGATVQLTGTPSSGSDDGTRSWALTGQSPVGTCTIDASTGEVTTTGVGTCTASASISQGTRYTSATSSSDATIIVGKADQSILISSTATSLRPGDTATLSSSGSSGSGATTFSVTSGSPSVCTLSGTTITAVDNGDCKVRVSIAEDDHYNSATSSILTIGVARLTRSITVDASPTSIIIGGTSTLSSSVTAGNGAKTYSITSGGSSCSVSGTTLTGTAAGSCTVAVSISSSGQYSSATSTNLVTVTVTDPNAGASSSSSGGNTAPPAAQAPATTPGNSANANKKIKTTTPTIVMPNVVTPVAPPSTAPSTQTSAGGAESSGSSNGNPGSNVNANAGGSATSNGGGNANGNGNAATPATPKTDPLPQVTVPLVTTDDETPIQATKASVDGPAKAKVADDGTLSLIVPIGYKGKVTVDVSGVPEGSCAAGSDCTTSITNSVDLEVEGPRPAVVPDEKAADRPRLLPDKPGKVTVVGLNNEVALSWRADPKATAYEVYQDGDLACLTVYSSCVVPATNGQVAAYAVKAVSDAGESTDLAVGTGKALKKGTLLATVYFDSADDTLTTGSKARLRKLVNDLLAMGLRQVAIVGNTDTRGSAAYNRDLSKGRANNVADFLDSRLVDPIIPDRAYLGESALAVPEKGTGGDWRNRRVELRVY